jgi:alcohol dehydrogenase (NADP+)
MLKVTAYGAVSATAPLTEMSIVRRTLGPLDVLIEVKFTGISHADIHHTRSEWRHERYPLVPGQEIVGIVADIGWAVTKHKSGDRVGVGALIDSCGRCTSCCEGREQDCLEGCTLTYACIDGSGGQLTQGGYSTHIVVTEGFVLKIPDAIDLDEAAPLLCAGITTYSPLRCFGVSRGTRVGVVGLGGLGHLGVKLAHAMGAEVSVFSRSTKKERDSRRLGADHYYATSATTPLEDPAGSFDLILNTASAAIDLGAYLPLLAVDGVLVDLGSPAEPMVVNARSLANGRRITSSFLGGIGETQDLLAFCAAHRIGADTEVISADMINEAYERVLDSDVRYRFVIDIGTLH